MSDSSTLSAGTERIAARLRVLAPGGRWEIYEGTVGETDGLDAFCLVSRSKPVEVPGFSLLGTRSHRVPQKLGDVVETLLQGRGLPLWLGAACRPGSMVGSRVCQTAVPGLNNHFYQLSELAVTSAPASGRLRDRLCTAGSLGHLPLIGATAASFVTCLLGAALVPLLSIDNWKLAMLVTAVLASVICVVLEKWAHRHYFAEDPREVVLDEVAGMALALAIAGPGFWTIAAAFFAFRFFDIFKPGIHWIEERGWPGTIVWDDLLAGLYAGAVVMLLSGTCAALFSP